MDDDAEQRYERVLVRVRALVAQADPEGLLALGAPSDEYDVLVADLTRRLLRGEELTHTALFGGWGSFAETSKAHALTTALLRLRGEIQPRC